MSSAAQIRQKIESDFQHRYPSVLSPAARMQYEVAPTGIIEVDSLLRGGLPVGAISEITGPTSSGRTTIALSFLARCTQGENVCAWVDTSDSLDPECAAACGVRLKHLLWVRCSSMPEKNRNLAMNSRPGANQPLWARLEQAIRATDLLLQAGGFASIVLDLADEGIEHCQRIPLATWFRFRQAADRNRCSVVVLGNASYAQSSAATVLACQPNSIAFSGKTVVCGLSFQATRGKERFSSNLNSVRKPAVACWSADVPWNIEKRA